MSNNLTTFEVSVVVEKRGTKRNREITYSGGERVRGKSFWVAVSDKVTKMFHVEARTGKQAMKKARKYGRPISARKSDIERMVGLSSKLELKQEMPYENAIAMDEMIWKKKRNRRINDKVKDNNGID